MGNPNVGKSTVFNEITGSHQHTGNWIGKTIDFAKGKYSYKYIDYELIDLPGTYSLTATSKEEKIARDYLLYEKYDCVVIVVDSTMLRKNLNLVYQVLKICSNAVVMLNLTDEAKKKNITIDSDKLSEILCVPVIKATARSGRGVNELLEYIHLISTNQLETECAALDFLEDSDSIIEAIGKKAISIEKECVITLPSKKERFDDKLDKILLGKFTSVIIMLIMLGGILWLTIVGSNYPSDALRALFDTILNHLESIMSRLNMPILTSLVVDGMLKVLFWVVAVMLPPMAIFFPLFAILEECGILPRFAFNLDRPFEKCGACGKQALCTCMGYGCNAVGVTGCRIIDSKRERLIAIITNSLTPCNGRFPLLIAIISMFFCNNSIGSAGILLCFLVLSISMTFLSSKVLSKTVLKGESSSVIMELPSYKKPAVLKIIKDTLREKILFVLLRAISVAIPAGIVIWVLGRITIGDSSLLLILSKILDPIGEIMGLDGVILLAFILSFPANEITLPAILMMYLSTGTLSDYSSLADLKLILVDNGWDTVTAISTCIFSMFHFPCSTTLLTIWKETKSAKWSIMSVIAPLICGFTLCVIVKLLSIIM